jgi:hypothetical protein
VLLNDNDDLWVEFRHVHIARVIEVLRQRMQDFVTTNAGAALAKVQINISCEASVK